MNQPSSSHRICPGCQEELAPAAYYRHQRRKGCPGRLSGLQGTNNSSDESSVKESDEEREEATLDSSFGCSDCESIISHEENVETLSTSSDLAEIDMILEDSSSSDDDCSLEDGEVWDDYSDTSDHEDSGSTSAKNVALGICFF